MKKHFGQLVYSPSDLVRYVASPFASWMERYYIENRDVVVPDAETEDAKLIAETGIKHERAVLAEFKLSNPDLVEIPQGDAGAAIAHTLSALHANASVIYQAALECGQFAGFADFLMLDAPGTHQVWDTKLARSPKPYYVIQLCCYSEMLAAMTGGRMPERFGIILGTREQVEFRVTDFFHYYCRVKSTFLAMQDGFTGKMTDRPEPLPGADHGRWASHAEKFFKDTDHLAQVADISVGQIKKLRNAGIATMATLAASSGKVVPKIAGDSLDKLVSQARLQCQTRADRIEHPDALPRYEILPHIGANGEPAGLAALPPDHPADVFFDMEGYPLVSGGLEYLFGVSSRDGHPDTLAFQDWWAHDRAEEKSAFEGFVDWVFARWKSHPGMHIYHYGAYEVNAARRLSTHHDTRQDEVDDLLRNEIFVDLYQTVRHGVRIGEDSYSIKKVERLYRPKRATEVTTAVDSIVQYGRWIESEQSREWAKSTILKSIRDYNEDDCKSTAELLHWLRKVATDHKIAPAGSSPGGTPSTSSILPPEVVTRLETAKALRKQEDPVSVLLADVIDFHRREEKPVWWRMFDRAAATSEELRDDAGCIEGVQAVGSPAIDKQSYVQRYRFNPAQECKLSAGGASKVMFSHLLEAKFTLSALDTAAGNLELKISKKSLNEKCAGAFPRRGSLIPDEYVSAKVIQAALTDVVARHLSGQLHPSVAALLNRAPPAKPPRKTGESSTDAAVRVTSEMPGGCLVIQGPPGTGKTYTASRVISSALAAGRRVGVASNSHKAVANLLIACGDAVRQSGRELQGIKVGRDADGPLLSSNPSMRHVETSGDALSAYTGGVVGGTAWLFTRPEWEGVLDFLFIDEAGQVPLANAVAMARCAKNLILLGDQMQLEQPVQGSHPGDAGLSVLQYALKNTAASRPDLPVFHAVVPADYGLFLSESRRMHPSVCRFISESIYEGRLASYPDCSRQKIVPPGTNGLITIESGIVFSGVEHDGDVQQSDEEVERVKTIYRELLGQPYTDREGNTRPLALEDFLFIAPYNAQVRALQSAFPAGARVGSVDKFQGQEAPVCILSLCSSYGEYGSRGLAFILDRNRINVAISRAKCLAVVVADPRIATVVAGSIDEMMLINLFCKLADPSYTT